MRVSILIHWGYKFSFFKMNYSNNIKTKYFGKVLNFFENAFGDTIFKYFTYTPIELFS